MDYIGKVTEIEVGGNKYKLSRFERRLVRKFLDWAETVLPNPLQQVKEQLDGFPAHLQEMMVREAILAARCKRNLNSPEVQALMNTPEGSGKIITLLFEEYQPELTEDQAWSIFEQARREHGDDYLEQKIAEASGQYPEEVKKKSAGRKSR